MNHSQIAGNYRFAACRERFILLHPQRQPVQRLRNQTTYIVGINLMSMSCGLVVIQQQESSLRHKFRNAGLLE